MNFPKTLSYNDFIDLVDTMFQSNRNLIVDTNFWKIESYDWYVYFDTKYMDHKPDVSVTSIKIDLPNFSIGDTVMIVDNGEVWEILWYTEIYWYNVSWKNAWRCKPSTLVKIPSDLLHKLQD